MPSYNYADFIEEALQSIVNQTFKDYEVVVVDDGSRDSSLQRIQKFQNKFPNFNCYQHPDQQNHGLPKTIQLAVEKATGVWIAFLEADDVWEPTCLSKRVEAIDDSDVAFCCNQIKPKLEKGGNKTWFDSYVPRVERKLRTLQEQTGCFDLQNLILQENLIPTFSCAMVRRDILTTCDFETPVAPWLDWYLWCQIFQKTKGVLIKEQLTSWRLHGNSQNSTKSLPQFLKNYSVFRNKLSGRLGTMLCEDSDNKISYLRRNSVFPLTVRVFDSIKEIGVLPFFEQVIKRFGLIK